MPRPPLPPLAAAVRVALEVTDMLLPGACEGGGAGDMDVGVDPAGVVLTLAVVDPTKAPFALRAADTVTAAAGDTDTEPLREGVVAGDDVLTTVELTGTAEGDRDSRGGRVSGADLVTLPLRLMDRDVVTLPRRDGL